MKKMTFLLLAGNGSPIHTDLRPGCADHFGARLEATMLTKSDNKLGFMEAVDEQVHVAFDLEGDLTEVQYLAVVLLSLDGYMPAQNVLPEIYGRVLGDLAPRVPDSITLYSICPDGECEGVDLERLRVA